MNSWETATSAVGKKCSGVTSSKEGHREIVVVHPFHRVMCDVDVGGMRCGMWDGCGATISTWY